METAFQIANNGVLPFWLLLIFAPRWKWTHVLCSIAVPLILGSLYLWLLSGGLGEGGFSSLADVMTLFRDPRTVLAGWVHYLAFDLFIGAWEARDAVKLGIPRWLLVPCQILTLLFGPLGLMLYILLRGVTKQQWEPGA